MTWTNVSKNSSTFTNVSKNTAAFTNQQKSDTTPNLWSPDNLPWDDNNLPWQDETLVINTVWTNQAKS